MNNITFFEVAHPDPLIREALKRERLGWPRDKLLPHQHEDPLQTYLRRCENLDKRIERLIQKIGLVAAVCKVRSEYGQ